MGGIWVALRGTLRMGKLHEVFRLFDGRILFYVREPTHRPPNVHVYGRNPKEFHAVFEYENGKWSARFNKGFSASELSDFEWYLQWPNRTEAILAKIKTMLPGGQDSE